MCSAIPTYSSNSETMAGIGLRFDFGDMNPEIVGIVRHTRTNTSNTVMGAQGEISIPLMKNGSFAPTIRALGLGGKPSVLGQAGAGYDFGSHSPSSPSACRARTWKASRYQSRWCTPSLSGR